MASVRSQNTQAEIKARRFLHKLGFRFCLHKKELPGSPDICLPKYKTAIFVHGCFWHRHAGCSRASTPASNRGYWTKKFARNVERDKRNIKELKLIGWQSLVFWECQIDNHSKLKKKLRPLISKRRELDNNG